jgi:hypothetical protein
MPVSLFQRFAPDTARMWRWSRTTRIAVDPALTRSIHPAALTVEAWLREQQPSRARS